MTAKRGTNRLRLYGIGAAVVLLAGLAAIYVTGGIHGNGDPECAPALVTADALRPLATGEIAAFQPAHQALSLAKLSFTDDGGKSTNLGAFAGRTVLLNLWATWCVPCRTEMPALAKLQATKGNPDFEVVAVNIDTMDSAKPKAFLKEVGADQLNFYADPTTDIFLRLRDRGLAVGLPTTLLIDGRGCQLGAMSGPAEWGSSDAQALITAALQKR